MTLKNLILKSWKEKTAEQKVLLAVTIIFVITDSIILTTDLFKGYILKMYLIFLVGQAVVKFIVLVIFNKNNLDHNLFASIPYLGGLYAIFYFFFPNKKPTED